MGNDAYGDKVSLLLHFDGADKSTSIIDEVSGIPVSLSGGVSLVTDNSRFGGTSCYFDGTNDYISLPYISEYDPGSTDFTVEMWTFCTQYNSSYSSMLCGTFSYGSVEGGTSNAGWALSIDQTYGYITFGWGNGGSWIPVLNLGALPLRVWCHLALCKVGNQYTIYLNGTSIGSTSYSTPITYTKTLFKIGAGLNTSSHTYFYYGYIDEFRITKGLARYTADFTPPIDKFSYFLPDNYWNFDVLLMRFNGANNSTVFVNETYNRKKATVGGAAKISTTQSKFGGSSANFNGTNSYITFPDSVDWYLDSDFTIEFWIYATSVSPATSFGLLTQSTSANNEFSIAIDSTGHIFIKRMVSGSAVTSTSTSVLVANTWTHVAICRIGTVVYHYTNGVASGSNTFTGNTDQSSQLAIGAYWYGGSFQAGRYFGGYLDELRITKGVARYTSGFTVPNKEFYYPFNPYWELDVMLMHFNGNSNGTVFDDECGNLVTTYGSVVTSTTQSKFGNSSGLFSGFNDYLSMPSSRFNFAGDFTMEAWVYFIGLPASYACVLEARSYGGYLDFWMGFANVSGTIRPSMVFTSGQVIGTTTSVPASAWTHFACVRIGSTVSMYINGIKDSTTFTNSDAVVPASSIMWIASMYSGDAFNGYIDELRITNGLGRYNGNFIVATLPYNRPSPSYHTESEIDLVESFGSTTQLNTISNDKTYYRILNGFDDYGTASVFGTVTIIGNPVPFTNVYLFTLDDKRLIEITQSDAVGGYIFSNLKDQDYFVWAKDDTETYNPVSRIAQKTFQ